MGRSICCWISIVEMTSWLPHKWGSAEGSSYHIRIQLSSLKKQSEEELYRDTRLKGEPHGVGA